MRISDWSSDVCSSDLVAAFHVEAVAQALCHRRADEGVDVAAEPADLLHEARGDELLAFRGHEEDGLDAGVEAGVHRRHLELVLEVRQDRKSTRLNSSH